MRDFTRLDPTIYVPSELHRSTRIFSETNCYTDLWIELLHARGLEPAAALSCGVVVDFEGDQWTFLKPNPSDLYSLYGIDVHEMQLYEPMTYHISEQLQRGQTMIIEVDSYYLPDTVGLTYRTSHQKSSIAIAGLNQESDRLVYFHRRGLYEAFDDDYHHLLRIDPDPRILPPYVELVRFNPVGSIGSDSLRRTAVTILAAALERRPACNPWDAYAIWLDAKLPALKDADFAYYQAFAFATVRQAGAAFQAAQDFTNWLIPGHVAVGAFARQVEGAKALSLKLARRRPFGVAEFFAPLASAYDDAMAGLEQEATR